MTSFNPLAKAQEYYGELWKSIVRPPRDEYTDLDLGDPLFRLSDGRLYQRSDFELTNRRGQRIVCSHFEPTKRYRPLDKLPCVIYLHGNCSSRVEAICALPLLLPLNITVVGFDFTGSGRSDGEYVTLGWNEREDLAEVIDYLREYRAVNFVGLWGRSMGAVTAIFHAHANPTVGGMVCDSPFSNLRQLAEELAEYYVPLPLPKFVVGSLISLLNSTIKAKAGFDLDDLDVAKVAGNTQVPAMFIAGSDDQFVRKHHAERLFELYPGDKWIVEAVGDHNSARSSKLMNSIAIFFYNTLHCAALFDSLRLGSQPHWLMLCQNAPEKSLFSSAILSSGAAAKFSEVDEEDNALVITGHDCDDDSDATEHSSEDPIGLRMQPPDREAAARALRDN